MNWKYILFHPRLAEKRMEEYKETIKKLERYLWGNREWKIIKNKDSSIANIICPCLTNAIHLDTKDMGQYFNRVECICPRCDRKLTYPEIKKLQCKIDE